MDIKLDERFRIATVDDYSVCIKERKVNNKKDSPNFGKYYWDIAGYYGSLEEVLHGYLRKSGIVLKGSTAEELLKSIKALDKKVDDFCKTHNKGFKDSWLDTLPKGRKYEDEDL